MASGLFAQYEAEYCSKATELSSKIEALAGLSPGAWVERATHYGACGNVRSALAVTLLTSPADHSPFLPHCLQSSAAAARGSSKLQCEKRSSW